ncbi:hypothetical protein [Actinoplanes sp. NPDC023714]|uniref:hypothetical protein n=1 Tax=Actinoplanes sp. NPDC023714 TaxID=3154322 RepID=UPI0033D8C1FC
MQASDIVALGSTAVAVAALILTAYLARLNLRHQQLEAHRGRLWERKVNTLLEFLEWLETDAADGRRASSGDAVDQAPRPSKSLYVRLHAFMPQGFMEELAAGSLAIGKWRLALARFDEGEAARADVDNAADEAHRHLQYMRALARNEVRLMPHRSEKITPAFLSLLQDRRLTRG